MDPAAIVAIAEILGDPQVQGAVILLVSTFIGASKRFGGERFKTARRVVDALKGKKSGGGAQ